MNGEMLYLDRSDIEQAGGNHSQVYVDALTKALVTHVRNDLVQSLEPYLRQDPGNGRVADRIIAMPGHIGGGYTVSGIKWIGSKHDSSSKRNMECASGTIILNGPEANYPIVVVEASLISSMHTAAVSMIVTKHLAKKGLKGLTIIGCGLIGDKQLQSMLKQPSHIKRVSVYDQLSRMRTCSVGRWQQQRPEINFTTAENTKEAVLSGGMVITCTITDQPYIEYDWLQEGTFINNISITDVHKEASTRTDKIVADDWSQYNREKKIINQLVLGGKLSKEAFHAELGQLMTGDTPGREDDGETILLNPMDIAIEDISGAYFVYQQVQQ